MIPVLTAQEVRDYDRYLIEEVGLAASELMERAASEIFKHLTPWLVQEPTSQVLIFSGRGNNGGDGITLARLLSNAEVKTQLVIVGDPTALSAEAAKQYELLLEGKSRSPIFEFSDSMHLAIDESSPLIIVDALLGTGASGLLRGDMPEAVQFLNQAALRYGAIVLSVDIPTGMDADTGEYEIDEEGRPFVVKANLTVTIAAAKVGFYRANAASITGNIAVAGLTDRADLQPRSHIRLVERSDVIAAYPRAENISSKYDFGHVLSVCGSRGMTGAAIMGGEAALRSGCGLVTVATSASERHIVAQAMAELMTVGLPETSTGAPTTSAWDVLEYFIKRADVLLIGSGMKPEPETADLLRKILREAAKPIVADAGALHAVAEDLSILDHRQSATILTPHAGELAKLIGIERKQVEHDRMAYARSFALEHKVTVVSKGAPTFTISPAGDVFVNTTGNVGLATAGTGDVLGGMIASTFARMTAEPTDAAWIAVYLHGAAADLAKTEWTTIGMTARDVTFKLGETYRSMGFE